MKQINRISQAEIESIRAKFIKIIREDYLRAQSKKEKTSLLCDYCLNTGLSRKYAIRTIRRQEDPLTLRPRKRSPLYTEEVTVALLQIWEVLGRPCGQRLKPVLEKEVDSLVQCGQLHISAEVAGKLKQISSATIDRKLKNARKSHAAGERIPLLDPAVIKPGLPGQSVGG